jgi:hypothetical protein
MPVRAEVQGHAARVERLGNLVAAPLRGAAIERARRQVAQAKLIVPLIDAAGLMAGTVRASFIRMTAPFFRTTRLAASPRPNAVVMTRLRPPA